MASQPMTVDEKHRCMSCGQSHLFAAEILGVRLQCAKKKIGITAGRNVHVQSRELFYPTAEPTRREGGVLISLCALDRSSMRQGGRGFYRLRGIRADLIIELTIESTKHKEVTPCEMSTLSQVG
jgi:hypothetical protein